MRVAEGRHHVGALMHGIASDEALMHLLKAIELARRAKQSRPEVALTGNRALVHLHREEFGAAVEAGERAVSMARELRSPLLPWTLATLSMALAEYGAVQRAIETLIEAIDETLDRDMAVQVCDTLLAALPVSMAAGRPLLAARLWGAATELESSGAIEIPPDDHRLAERVLARVRANSAAADVETATRDGAETDPSALLNSLQTELSRGAEASAEPARSQGKAR